MNQVRLQQISVLRRWKTYRSIAQGTHQEGQKTISIGELAEKIGIIERRVNEDLELMSIPVQHNTVEAESFFHLLGRYQSLQDQQTDAVIVASGLLGRLVLSAPEFYGPGVKALGIFTPLALEIGSLSGIPCYSMEKIEPLSRQLKIKVGILCVPQEEAQSAADALVRGGVTGIWNWSLADLIVPDTVAILREDLCTSSPA